jgi:hypothetical protein
MQLHSIRGFSLIQCLTNLNLGQSKPSNTTIEPNELMCERKRQGIPGKLPAHTDGWAEAQAPTQHLHKVGALKLLTPKDPSHNPHA